MGIFGPSKSERSADEFLGQSRRIASELAARIDDFIQKTYPGRRVQEDHLIQIMAEPYFLVANLQIYLLEKLKGYSYDQTAFLVDRVDHVTKTMLVPHTSLLTNGNYKQYLEARRNEYREAMVGIETADRDILLKVETILASHIKNVIVAGKATLGENLWWGRLPMSDISIDMIIWSEFADELKQMIGIYNRSFGA